MVALFIKKRTLSIFLLLLLLTVSFYFVSDFTDKNTVRDSEKPTDSKVMAPLLELEEESAEEGKYEKNSHYFIEYRLERDRLRSQEIEMLREIINNPNSEKKVVEKAQQDLLKIVELIEKEMVIENLIKAKGFEDAVIFFTDSGVNVVVKIEKLSEKQVAQISDIVSKGSGVPIDKITIIEKNINED